MGLLLLLVGLFDFELMGLALRVNEVHAGVFNARSDVVAFIVLVVHGVVRQVVDAGAHLAHDQLHLALLPLDRRHYPLLLLGLALGGLLRLFAVNHLFLNLLA